MNNNIEQYIQQLMALQQKNQNDQISKQELEEIATRLGFNVGEIYKAKNDFMTAGHNYLKFGNYEDALKEFSQALVLDNQNADLLFFVASCHKGIYHHKHQKKDKELAIEYAKKAVKIDPNHQKAFALISSFQENNNVPREFNRQYQPKTNHTTTIFVIVGIILGGLGALFMLLFSSIASDHSKVPSMMNVQSKSINSSRNTSISQIIGGIAQEKSYIWVIYYTQSYQGNTYNKQYKAKIIDAGSKSMVKEIELKSGIDFMHPVYEQPEIHGENIYFCSKDFYEVRDLKSGEIVDSKAILAQKYSQLKEGVADIERYASGTGWYVITTRKNDKYYYKPIENIILGDNQRTNLQLINLYKWYANNNKANIDTEFMLLSEPTYPINVYDHYKNTANIMDKFSWENYKKNKINNRKKNVVTILEKSFLGGEMIYGTEKYFFGRYRQEPQEDNQAQNLANNPQSKFVYFCADVASGKVLWEKKFQVENSVVLATLKYINASKRHIVGDKLAITNPYISIENQQVFGMTVIDLKTGEIVSDYAEKR